MHLSIQELVDALGARGGVPFALSLPGGARYPTGDGQPVFEVAIRTEGALLSALARGHIGLLDAYFDGQVDIQGDIAAALGAGLAAGLDARPNVLNQLENDLHELRHSNHTHEQAKANARAHYGLGHAFYALWLDDPLLMYTCGYWPPGTASLEEAQRRKIDHVCRKLRLSAKDRFVDIGCGFGGFMFRAQQTTGARGLGVNTCTEQIEWLQREIDRRGVGGVLSVREADFRDVDGPYDKVVSLGVLEHAGRDQLAEVIRAHADFLKPGGLGILHFIGHLGAHETELFIRKHVFPGGWIPGLADVVSEMERCGLEVVDVENLRRHYAPTLDEWARRFDANWDAIRTLDPARFDERFRRIWRVYLIGCAEMFRSPSGYTHLFQVVFSKGNVDASSYPMGRDWLYGHGT